MYVCVLCASRGSSQFCALHDLQFVNAGRGCKRRPYGSVILGFAARQSLKVVTDNKTISELAVLTFKTECVQLLSVVTAKLIERCPLNYPLVRYLSSLDSPKMISSTSDVTAKFEKILQILMNGNWHSAEECDELLSHYKAFLVQMKQDHALDFRDFTPDNI